MRFQLVRFFNQMLRLAANERIAPSVGSPLIDHLLSAFWVNRVLLHNKPTDRSCFNSSHSVSLPTASVILPSGVNPFPETLYSLLIVAIFFIVISFVVNVPVLSEQMTVVLP